MSQEKKHSASSSTLKALSHSHDGCCDHKNSVLFSKPNTSVEPKEGEVVTVFNVVNMDCVDEIKAIKETLVDSRIISVEAFLMSSTVRVVHKDDLLKELIEKKINQTVVKVVADTAVEVKAENKIRILKVSFSGLLFICGFFFELMNVSPFVYGTSYFLSMILGGQLVFPKAIASLRRMAMDMNVLMTFAAVGAVIIGEIEEAAAVVFLFALSELLESLSVQKARNAISKLLKMTPQVAQVLKSDGNTIEKEVAAIKVGEIIRVRAGESIALDGIVEKGQSSVNQAALTGESIPIFKTVGDILFAGTINQDGSLDIKVTSVFSETKISKLVQLVSEAQSMRAPAQRFVDQFAKYYTPIIFSISVLTFIIPVFFLNLDMYTWFYKSLVLLVIACPCALVISTPVSIVSGLTALARRGVLVKGGAYLEELGRIRALAVDKTGTLTKGMPEIIKVIPLNSCSEREIIEWAASLEVFSTHPIAKAIVNYGKELGINHRAVFDFKNYPGRGIEANIEGYSYFLGNHRFIQEMGLCDEDLEKQFGQYEENIQSLIILGSKNQNGEPLLLGFIVLADQLRSEALEALAEIRASGVSKIILISGDNQRIASLVGSQVNADFSVGDLLPEGKVHYIDKLKNEFQFVGMLGDGVNDAPAMAKSSVGIAMGGIGSDTAIEVADVALMTDDLKQLAKAIGISRSVLNVIKFNITFAILLKAIFLALTFMGHSSLWMAIVADTGATLIVILNSLRLLKDS